MPLWCLSMSKVLWLFLDWSFAQCWMSGHSCLHFSLLEAFLRTSVHHTWLIVTHIIFILINNIEGLTAGCKLHFQHLASFMAGKFISGLQYWACLASHHSTRRVAGLLLNVVWSESLGPKTPFNSLTSEKLSTREAEVPPVAIPRYEGPKGGVWWSI